MPTATKSKCQARYIPIGQGRAHPYMLSINGKPPRWLKPYEWTDITEDEKFRLQELDRRSGVPLSVPDGESVTKRMESGGDEGVTTHIVNRKFHFEYR